MDTGNTAWILTSTALVLFMTFSAYFPDDFHRSRHVLDFFEQNNVNMENLSLKLLDRLYNREFPYYEHMKTGLKLFLLDFSLMTETLPLICYFYFSGFRNQIEAVFDRYHDKMHSCINRCGVNFALSIT